MALERQPSALPPAQPSFIFRGHASQIHSVRIVHQNRRLVTGDADGWVVYWRLESKRPIAVWKAHEGAILGISEWGTDKFITHGRDHTLRIWQLRAADESKFSTVLPAEGATIHRPNPWLLHSLPVNTLNFCAFSMCHDLPAVIAPPNSSTGQHHQPVSPSSPSSSILVAVPATDDKKIEVYQFPDEKLRYVVPRVQLTDTGMVMAVKLTPHPFAKHIVVIAGYEGGFTAVHLLPRTSPSTLAIAQLIYLSDPHTQPILSLQASPNAEIFFTSSADAVISSHRIPPLPLHMIETEIPFITKAKDSVPVQSSFAASPDDLTQGLVSQPYAEPNEISAALNPEPTTSETLQGVSLGNAKGIDVSPVSQEPVTSALPAEGVQQESSSPVAATSEPLEFSKKSLDAPTPVSPLSFGKQSIPSSTLSNNSSTTTKPSGLSSLLSSAPSHSKAKPPPPAPAPVTMQPPLKSNNTKHAGQQSLRVRSDGRLLVTGGWDSRVRIYSTKTLKEVAVLKWHKEGVFAVDFGQVLENADLRRGWFPTKTGAEDETDDKIITKEHGLGRLQRQREEQMQLKHWVAAGAKDGKVSLWEVF